jgi:arginase
VTREVHLIGVPTDIGASVRGAGMGPDALRVAGIAAAIARQGAAVTDLGNLTGPANPSAEPVKGFRHLDEVVTWNRLVHDAVLVSLRGDALPVVMGHARRRPLRVLWLDAHADCNTAEITPSGNLHGMPVACLFGFGPQALTNLAGMPGGAPALRPDQFRQIGVRSVDAREKDLVHHLGLDVYDMRTIDEMGMRHVVSQALMQLPEDAHLHVSFDVDFLDPSIAPGVGTDVQGGPTYREAQLCMEMIADTGRLGSLDLVELNPARDVRNRTAELMVDLTESLFGKSTLMRR